MLDWTSTSDRAHEYFNELREYFDRIHEYFDRIREYFDINIHTTLSDISGMAGLSVGALKDILMAGYSYV